MRLKTILAAASMALALGTGAAKADVVIGNFNIENGSPQISAGTITFTLNGNGTIGASVTVGGNIIGIGFDSAVSNLPESGFTPTAPDNPFGWTDMYGLQASGFLCTACGSTESWTIGNPGDFTSALQAISGNNSAYDFFLFDGSNQWAGDGVLQRGVPEPTTWAMMILGLGGLGVVARRRKAIAA